MATAKKVKVTIELEKDLNEMLQIMAKNAEVSTNKVMESMAKHWIAENLDLLTKGDLQKFKHLLYNAE